MAKPKKSVKSREEEILEKLGKLNDEATQIQSEIVKLTEESEIIKLLNSYKYQLNATVDEMDTLIKDNGESLTGWKTDRISKGKKDIIAFGTNAILRSKTTRRKIIPSKFIEKYPLEANVLIEEGKITIPIGVVEEELGKNKVNEMCEATTTFNYKYESRKVPTSISVNEMKKEPAIENKKTHKASKKMKVTAR
jgi:hypothetical protein